MFSIQSCAYTRVVTPLQFGRILHFLGLNVNPQDLKLLVAKFQDPASGDVDYPSFVQAVDDGIVLTILFWLIQSPIVKAISIFCLCNSSCFAPFVVINSITLNFQHRKKNLLSELITHIVTNFSRIKGLYSMCMCVCFFLFLKNLWVMFLRLRLWMSYHQKRKYQMLCCLLMTSWLGYVTLCSQTVSE